MRKKVDWERLIIRFLGIPLGVIFAAYLVVGPRWICRAIQVIHGQEVQPAIAARWSGQVLIIDASPGSLYLVGGNRDDTWIGSGHVELPAVGVDANRTPIGRDALVLKNNNGQVIATLAIPEQPKLVYEQRLVLIVRPP